MPWCVQGGKLVVGPGGQIFVSGDTFDYYMSPTGDDNNVGSLGSPWSITAFNTKDATYAGKRVGLLPGVYQHGTVGGVQTTLYAIAQANPAGGQNIAAFNIISVNGGTSSAAPTYVASCDISGRYSARTATIDPSNPSGGAIYTTECAVIGQAYSARGIGVHLANTGYLTLDGLVVRNWNQWGIGFFPKFQPGNYPYTGTTTNLGIRIQNCEIYTGTGSGNDNMSGVGMAHVFGAYVGNCKIHDITGTGNQGNVNGIGTFNQRSQVYEYNTIYNVPTGIHDKNQGGATNGNGNGTIRYNFVECVAASTSAPSPLQDCAGGIAGDLQQIYNNIFYIPTGNASCWYGSDFTNPCPSALLFYNNTCIYGTNANPGIMASYYSGNVTAYNNIMVCQGVHSGYIWAIYTPAYLLGAYNVYDDSTHAPGFGSATASGYPNHFSANLTAFQSDTGQDATSEVATPTFSGSFGVQIPTNYQLTGSVGVGFGHVGGVGGGAVVNAGAWDGVVTQIGANFNYLIIAVTGGLPVPPAAVGVPYEITMSVLNSLNLISWSVVSGPAWFSMSSLSNSMGLGSGTPTVSGPVSATIQATDTVTGDTGTITI